MTEMVYGAIPTRDGEPVLPRWWRTIDKWSVCCVLILFGIGLLLGLAASPPLAERNGFSAFHYVERQAIYGLMAFTAMFAFTLMAPRTVRRLAVIGFALSLIALMLLPFFGTDYGKGATRWFSLGFGAVQPSEFLKPGFIVVAGWMIAASTEVAGPPGKSYSFGLALFIVLLLALQPDFGQACLILFAWGVMYFVGGAPFLVLAGIAGLAVVGGALTASSRQKSTPRPSLAMPQTPSARAASLASVSAKAPSNGPCRTRTPISSSRSRPRNTG